jgi:hypothetical protein
MSMKELADQPTATLEKWCRPSGSDRDQSASPSTRGRLTRDVNLEKPLTLR